MSKSSTWRYYDVAVAAIWVAGLIPSPAFWQNHGAWDTILGFTPRLLVASFVAYLVGEFANSSVLAKMKVWTGGKYLWSRTISSTLVAITYFVVNRLKQAEGVDRFDIDTNMNPFSFE
jgi:hypothetical protein